MRNSNEVRLTIRALDEWVAKHGSGKYASRAFMPLTDFAIPEDDGIQQDREELFDFARALFSRNKRKTALEIGLGYYGSTHFLWRYIFKRVITVEKSHDRIRHFGSNMREFFQKWVLDDGRSSFIIGMSNDCSTVAKTYQCAKGGIDLLFIDGDHQYSSVLTDWLLYSPIVKKGGMVAFHDVALTIKGHFGVREFVHNLEAGEIDGEKRKMKRIVHTNNMGIAYYWK